jgi:hypothetical protein
VAIRTFTSVLKQPNFEVFGGFRYEGELGFKRRKLGIIRTLYLTFPQNFGFLAHLFAEGALFTHIYI